MAATLAGGLVLPMPAFGQPSADRTLSDARVENVGACSALTINFNIRVQVLSSFPEKRGRELHIRIQPLDSTLSADGRESLRPPSSLPDLASIQYEGDNPGGPVLSLFFAKDMAFSVESGTQQNSILVRLSDPRAGDCAVPQGPNVETSPAAPAAVQGVPAGLYALNLQSLPSEPGALSDAQASALAGKVIYDSTFERESQTWHRLRAGFYESRAEADAAKAKLASLFPGAWVVKVTPEERAQGVAGRRETVKTTAPAPTTPVTPPAANGPADGSETARLIEQAEGAIRDGQNDRAVALLTNALSQPENANTPRALELLGVTREKNGQIAHAQAEYEEYLRRYPSGEDAERVRQRLVAIAPAGAAAIPALRQASGRAGAGKDWTWGVRGSISQFYFRDQGRRSSDTFATNSTLGTEVDNSLNVNQLLSSADITLSGGNDRQQFQLRGAGSYTKNFGTSASVTTINNGGSNTTFRSKPGGGLKALTALYLDWTSSDFGSQVRIGRQTRNSQGVLGRFDGVLVGWQARPKLRFNVVGGFPVQSSRQTWVMKERPFYGLSVDLGNKKSPIQTTFYYFDEHARGGFVDRRSVGFEGRYAKKKFNAFTLIDYDVKFNRLNLGLLSMSYNFPDSSNLTLTADYRQSPLLTTTNATYGQILVASGLPVMDLRDLKPFFTDPQIYQMAKDTTLTAKTVTLAYSRPLTKKLQANFDVSMTDTGGTVGVPATADILGIAPIPVTGKEYYYGAQLIGSGLFWDSDIFILSGRYANTQRANTWTADINARVPITNKFRLSPRVRYGERKEKLTNGDFSQFQPTMRMNWYPLRHGEVEIEFGGNFSRQTQIVAGNPIRTRESGYVLSAGYRLDF